ncbi:uncharacterized protein EI97DRAFT_123975 [Westerdykella ornata]|uniref:Uncharacterized protein n=1 Tax=Westerdykella ornata TaxID=318751 RepID=A0A6A6JXK4_WESOR|nr:uncharacterized protein EI97DRAFT_123975 [Westerdykella ornata]KAF2280466.1 hypothetical protein EI97DRAFT_123975 [Westerdykella ornata]
MVVSRTKTMNLIPVTLTRLVFGVVVIAAIAVCLYRPQNWLYDAFVPTCEEVIAALRKITGRAFEELSLQGLPQSLQQSLRLLPSILGFQPTIILHDLREFSRNSIFLIAEHIQRIKCSETNFEQLLRQLHDLWSLQQRFPRPASVLIAAIIPSAIALSTHGSPESSVVAYRSLILVALCILTLAGVWVQTGRLKDVLLIAAVMAAMEILQKMLLRKAGHYHGDLSREKSLVHPISSRHTQRDSEPHNQHEEPHDTPSTEKQRGRNRKCQSFDASSLRANLVSINNDRSPRRRHSQTGPAFAEQSSTQRSDLEEETRKIKQAIARDHQAVVYRKDIELFALRKALQHKEGLLREREAQLEDAYRQRNMALEQKETYVRALKDRIATYEGMDQPKSDSLNPGSGDEQCAAVQVRLLHIKGRNSQEHTRFMEEKDLEIARLRQELATFHNGSEGMKSLQEELRRAWDCTQQTQNTLIEERRKHTQTKHKLREMAIRLDEELRKSQKNSPSRLPTIQESDKQELEAMFNAAQEENLRLHSERDSLEKRLREANGRLFSIQHELEVLRKQLRLEKSVHEDMETARPSLVYLVHFQRLEGQLKEVRNLLDERDHQLERLAETASTKQKQLEETKAAKNAAEATCSAMQAELERLKNYTCQLETTKEQLMHDRERFAHNRLRKRDVSKDIEGARFSGATLTVDPLSHEFSSAHREPTPPLPSHPTTVTTQATGLIQSTSAVPTPRDHHKANTTNDSATMSTVLSPALPSHTKHSRRKSITLKSLIRKVTRKDSTKVSAEPTNIVSNSGPVLAPIPANLPLRRPQTSTAVLASQGRKEGKALGTRPMTAASTGTAAVALARLKSEERTLGVRLKEVPVGMAVGRPRSAALPLASAVDRASGMKAEAVVDAEIDCGAVGGKDEHGQDGGGTESVTPRDRKPTIRVWSGSGSSKKIVRRSVT